MRPPGRIFCFEVCALRLPAVCEFVKYVVVIGATSKPGRRAGLTGTRAARRLGRRRWWLGWRVPSRWCLLTPPGGISESHAWARRAKFEVAPVGAPGRIEKCRPSGSRAEAADGDARQWLIDNDLWDGSVGMAPEIRPVADTPHPDADATTIDVRSPRPSGLRIADVGQVGVRIHRYRAGLSPTATVPVTVCVIASITDTLPSAKLVT